MVMSNLGYLISRFLFPLGAELLIYCFSSKNMGVVLILGFYRYLIILPIQYITRLQSFLCVVLGYQSLKQCGRGEVLTDTAQFIYRFTSACVFFFRSILSVSACPFGHFASHFPPPLHTPIRCSPSFTLGVVQN